MELLLLLQKEVKQGQKLNLKFLIQSVFLKELKIILLEYHYVILFVTSQLLLYKKELKEVHHLYKSMNFHIINYNNLKNGNCQINLMVN